MPRTYSQEGPIARALELVGERWTLLVLQELLKGVSRFADLENAVEGISPNVLSSRLKNLEEHGIVERKFYSAHPPRAEYLLTRKGHELGVVAGALAGWGSRHTKGEIELIHDDCGKSVEVIYQCGSCEGPVPRSRVRLEQPRAS